MSIFSSDNQEGSNVIGEAFSEMINLDKLKSVGLPIIKKILPSLLDKLIEKVSETDSCYFLFKEDGDTDYTILTLKNKNIKDFNIMKNSEGFEVVLNSTDGSEFEDNTSQIFAKDGIRLLSELLFSGIESYGKEDEKTTEKIDAFVANIFESIKTDSEVILKAKELNAKEFGTYIRINFSFESIGEIKSELNSIGLTNIDEIAEYIGRRIYRLILQ